MRVYYNENAPKAAAMLRQMMSDGLIAAGDVDERSIVDVQPGDLAGYTRCHFFAGIGGWELALQLAGWPADRPVWTGSCPCQPFSSAGRQKGKTDERHLWPEWFRLIRECRPATIFGEQVASAVTHGWLDDVYQGLEAEDYSVGAAVLPACCVGAPHRRDRLWFVAHAKGRGRGELRGTQGSTGLPDFGGSDALAHPESPKCEQPHHPWGRGSRASGLDSVMADTHRGVSGGLPNQADGAGEEIRLRGGLDTAHACGPMGNTYLQGLEEHGRSDELHQRQERKGAKRSAFNPSFWNGNWIKCPDEKQRVVEPSIPLLVDGFQHRKPILHALGNAIVPQVAAEFIRAAMN